MQIITDRIVTCIHIGLKDRVNCNILLIFFSETEFDLQSLSINTCN